MEIFRIAAQIVLGFVLGYADIWANRSFVCPERETKCRSLRQGFFYA